LMSLGSWRRLRWQRGQPQRRRRDRPQRQPPRARTQRWRARPAEWSARLRSRSALLCVACCRLHRAALHQRRNRRHRRHRRQRRQRRLRLEAPSWPAAPRPPCRQTKKHGSLLARRKVQREGSPASAEQLQDCHRSWFSHPTSPPPATCPPTAASSIFSLPALASKQALARPAAPPLQPDLPPRRRSPPPRRRPPPPRRVPAREPSAWQTHSYQPWPAGVGSRPCLRPRCARAGIGFL
jgi:hypothetical protein